MERIRVLPAWLYQRCRPVCDHLVPGAGMLYLFMRTNQSTDALPREWSLFIAGGMLIATLAKPVAGYVVFVLSLAYPLYTISIYVAALALALLIPPIFFLADHLTAVIMILIAPVLIPYRIASVVPLLAGLWWAEWGGALVGLGSSLWLKVLAGMSGAEPDLIQLGGQSLATSELIARFHTANSLQTLRWLAEPLTPDPETALLHVLQILGWGLAGYAVGLMRQRMAGMARPAMGLLAGVSAGLLGLGAGVLTAPVLLGLRQVQAAPVPFLIECGLSGAIAMAAYALYRYLTRPAVLPSAASAGPHRPSARPKSEPLPRPVVRSQSPDEAQRDIIMIDLD